MAASIIPDIADDVSVALRVGQPVYWVRRIPFGGFDPLPAVVTGIDRLGIRVRVAEPGRGLSWRLRERWVQPWELRPRTRWHCAVDPS